MERGRSVHEVLRIIALQFYQKGQRNVAAKVISMYESRVVSRGERTREVALLFSIRDDIWMESRVGLTGCRSIWARSPLRGYDFVLLAATNPRLFLASLYPRTTNRCFFRTLCCSWRKERDLGRLFSRQRWIFIFNVSRSQAVFEGNVSQVNISNVFSL